MKDSAEIPTRLRTQYLSRSRLLRLASALLGSVLRSALSFAGHLSRGCDSFPQRMHVLCWGLSLEFPLRSPRFWVALRCPLLDGVGRRREWSCSRSAVFEVGGAFRAFCCCPTASRCRILVLAFSRELARDRAGAVATVRRLGCRRQVDLGSSRPSSLLSCRCLPVRRAR